jgi:glucose/arabinose dehydrogenase
MRNLLCLLFLAPLAAAAADSYRSQEHSFRVVRLVHGLDHPWSLAFMPDGRMLVTERRGRVYIVAKNFERAVVSGVPEVVEQGQGGLFEIALHPRFAENGIIYLAYAGRGEGGVSTELARARLAGTRLEELRVIFRQAPKASGGLHFGGRIVFDRAGFLYLTLGERGDRDRAQDPGSHHGSVIRLHDDGSVPKDNPFVGKAGWRPEKFTLGNRNLQGAAIHPQTGMLWTHEHGPQGGDEINVIRAGTNYGWPVITYGANYGTGTKIGEGTQKAGMAQPLYYWVPSIAPSGMAFYTGDRFPRWKGNLFVGALKDQMLVRLALDGEKVLKEERLLKGVLGRIRDVRDGPDGYLYLLTDEINGVMARLEP